MLRTQRVQPREEVSDDARSEQTETGNQTPPTEVPPVGEHVPVKSPERAGKGAADRGAL